MPEEAPKADDTVGLTEAMAIVDAADVAAFLTGMQTGLYPRPCRQFAPAGFKPNGKTRWRPDPRWRRGDLEAAVVRMMQRRIAGK